MNTQILGMYIMHDIFSPFYALSFNTTLLFISYPVIIQILITVTIIHAKQTMKHYYSY